MEHGERSRDSSRAVQEPHPRDGTRLPCVRGRDGRASPAAALLDEPDAGLDPATTAALPRLLRGDGAPERAIILSCHDLHLALDLADDVAVLVGGRFAFAAPARSLTPAALRRAYDGACSSER